MFEKLELAPLYNLYVIINETEKGNQYKSENESKWVDKLLLFLFSQQS